ncbi:MAG: hypothetical protein HY331_07045 [Chloroflexi bacterium]|nr:hypothetical protein [Chloroflexota bacterium]
MVAEGQDAFRQQYGFASDAVPSRGFLTWADLEYLAGSFGLHWRHYRPIYGLRWQLRPIAARLRGRREPATFAVIVGRRP